MCNASIMIVTLPAHLKSVAAQRARRLGATNQMKPRMLPPHVQQVVVRLQGLRYSFTIRLVFEGSNDAQDGAHLCWTVLHAATLMHQCMHHMMSGAIHHHVTSCALIERHPGWCALVLGCASRCHLNDVGCHSSSYYFLCFDQMTPRMVRTCAGLCFTLLLPPCSA